MPEINKDQLVEHIRKSDLNAEEKRFLEKLVERTKWIPCRERPPELFETVLVALKDDNYEWYYDVSERIHFVGKKRARWIDLGGETPTHWMPLPEPPEMEEEQHGS